MTNFLLENPDQLFPFLSFPSPQKQNPINSHSLLDASSLQQNLSFFQTHRPNMNQINRMVVVKSSPSPQQFELHQSLPASLTTRGTLSQAPSPEGPKISLICIWPSQHSPATLGAA